MVVTAVGAQSWRRAADGRGSGAGARALTVGGVAVVDGGAQAAARPEAGTGAGGGLRAVVAVLLVNAGDEPVTAAATALSTPGQRTAGEPEPVLVPAAGAAAAHLALEVDCSAVGGGAGGSPTDPAVRPGEDVVEVVTTARDGTLRDPLVLPVLSGPGGVHAELAWACDPASFNGLTARAGSQSREGRLEVEVTNAGPEAVVLAARHSGGARLVADPPLPLAVEGGSSVLLLLDLVPHCATPGGDPAAGPAVELGANLLGSYAGVADPSTGHPLLSAGEVSRWSAGRAVPPCT